MIVYFKMKKIQFIFLFCIPFFGMTQSTVHSNDTLPQFVGSTVVVHDKEFIRQYRLLKPRVVKVYPYALFAADLLDQMNNDLARIEKRRKRNKFCKKSYQTLKEEFKYVLLDMYTSEGKVLMKLISRETGMTVHEIITKYRGRKDAAMFNLMGKMFEQDIKTVYNPKKEYVIEAILRDIKSGKIKFDDTVIKVGKTEYKDKKKQSKNKSKANHKKAKALKKQKRKQAKDLKKEKKVAKTK